jgi:anti-anti-sigma regulatory factor
MSAALDPAAFPILSEDVERIVGDAVVAIMVDLRGLRLIDSAGPGTLRREYRGIAPRRETMRVDSGR